MKDPRFMSRQNILRRVLAEAQQFSGNCVCVFDLDSTLICVRGRTQAILRSAPDDPPLKQICAGQVDLFKTIEVHPTDYGLKQILIRKGIRLSSSCFYNLSGYWTHCFFSGDFLKHDELYKGVCSYLSQLKKTNVDIMYLTGRSQKSMGKGTYKQLKGWSLPLKRKEFLMMKQNNFTEDAVYKVNCLEKLSQRYKRIWFFENEPATMNLISQKLPEVQLVFVNSVHSGRQTLRKKIPSIGMDYSI